MTRREDWLAAAEHLGQLPDGAMVRIGNDGEGPDPGQILCQIVLGDDTRARALGDTAEEAARLAVAGLMVTA